MVNFQDAHSVLLKNVSVFGRNLSSNLPGFCGMTPPLLTTEAKYQLKVLIELKNISLQKFVSNA